MQKTTSIEAALNRKYPEPVVLVTSGDIRTRANVMAVGWYTLVSSEPWMFLIGVDTGAFTHDLIRKYREFTVAFPSESMSRSVHFAGTVHGHRRDKIREAQLAIQPATQIRAPLIADAVANFECRLVRTLHPGDCPLFMGEIVAAHVARQSTRHRLYTVAPGYRLQGVRPHSSLELKKSHRAPPFTVSGARKT